MARAEVGRGAAQGADEVLYSVVRSIPCDRSVVEASFEDPPDEVGAGRSRFARASIDALHEPVGKAKADLPTQCHDSRICIPTATRMQYAEA